MLSACIPVLLAGALPAGAAFPPKLSFSPGEKAVYQVTYFGATAGMLEIETASVPSKFMKSGIGFEVAVRTRSMLSLLYRLKNIYRTVIDPVSGTPIKFAAELDESLQQGSTTQVFDQRRHLVHLLDSREHVKKGLIHKDLVKKIAPNTQDVVSALFYLRSLPLKKGQSFELPIFVGEELYYVRVEVVDEEELSTKVGRIPAFVLSPTLITREGKQKELPEMQIWIGKTAERPLLKIKAKAKVGSVIAYLSHYETRLPAATP